MRGATPPFRRTRCACANELENCRTKPGYLIPRDVSRIASWLSITVSELLRTYLTVGIGFRFLRIDTRTESVTIHTAQSITPKRLASGCIFLENDRCRIHPVAPYGCAYFDVHMSEAVANPRSEWGLHAIIGHAGYRELLEALHAEPSEATVDAQTGEITRRHQERTDEQLHAEDDAEEGDGRDDRLRGGAD